MLLTKITLCIVLGRSCLDHKVNKNTMDRWPIFRRICSGHIVLISLRMDVTTAEIISQKTPRVCHRSALLRDYLGTRTNCGSRQDDKVLTRSWKASRRNMRFIGIQPQLMSPPTCILRRAWCSSNTRRHELKS